MQLAAQLLPMAATHAQVPYKGNAPALTDLLGGHVDMMFQPAAGAVGMVGDGKVRALAVTGSRARRSFGSPTIAQAGCRDMNQAALRHRRAGGRAAADRRQAQPALHGVLDAADVRQHLSAAGAEVLASTPDAYAADIAAEEAKWSPIVRKAGVKAE